MEDVRKTWEGMCLLFRQTSDMAMAGPKSVTAWFHGGLPMTILFTTEENACSFLRAYRNFKTDSLINLGVGEGELNSILLKEPLW